MMLRVFCRPAMQPACDFALAQWKNRGILFGYPHGIVYKTAKFLNQPGERMTAAWNTKSGGRRVRHDPPTIEEALEAAECFAEGLDNQIAVAAQLMGVSEDEVRAVAQRAQRRATTIQRVAPATPSPSGRAVIVERRTTRRRIVTPGA
jgi:hypothetical protein